MKILLVDDEVLMGRLTRDLAVQNYVVDTTTDGLLGWEYARSTPYDLIVLDDIDDIDLPDLAGLALCRRLHQTGYGGASLMLTGHGSSTDKVEGLNAGQTLHLQLS
jgi:DNA-binding response OmpR family regulator